MTIITNSSELSKVLSEQLNRLLPGAIEKAKTANPEQLFTISQVARKMGKSYDTIKRMVTQNRLKTTADGKYISQAEINNYLKRTENV